MLRTLGREDDLKAPGQLDPLAASFARLYPPQIGTRRVVGPMLIVEHYLSRLGRALEAVAPITEELPGELVVKTAAELSVAVGASRLHLDLTAVRFAGAYEGSAPVEKGWAADRTITRQVKTLHASTKAGVAVYFRPHKGSSSELPAFVAAIETLAETLPPGLVVADSGLSYVENLCAADAKHVDFVVLLRADTGWAERLATDVPGGLDSLEPLDYVSFREQRLDPDRRTVWKGLLRPCPVTAQDGTHHDLRVAYIFSSEEANSVADAPERALTTANDALTPIRNRLGGSVHKTRRQVDAEVAQILTGNVGGLIVVTTGTRAGKPVISWRCHEHTIAAAGALDGLYALATNLPDPRGGRLDALRC